MKINIAFPATGCEKSFVIDDEKKLHSLYDKRMSQEVDGASLGDEFKGYIFKIMGGNDKQGFPMKQGVLVNHRVRLLLKKGQSCFRERYGKPGQRKRKSIRGCIVGPDISALHLTIVKKGAEELPGLTTDNIPRRLGPKRANNIRKLFNLSKEDDVRKYVVTYRRVIPARTGVEGKKDRKETAKCPKIQRLVTPERIHRKKRVFQAKSQRAKKFHQEKIAYNQLIAERKKERQALFQKKQDQKNKKTEKKAPEAKKQ